MEKIMPVLKFIMDNYQAIISGAVGVLSGLVAIFLVIPGPHPEDYFQKAADFLSKFSKK